MTIADFLRDQRPNKVQDNFNYISLSVLLPKETMQKISSKDLTQQIVQKTIKTISYSINIQFLLKLSRVRVPFELVLCLIASVTAKLIIRHLALFIVMEIWARSLGDKVLNPPSVILPSLVLS